jgi:hypothetical protein
LEALVEFASRTESQLTKIRNAPFRITKTPYDEYRVAMKGVTNASGLGAFVPRGPGGIKEARSVAADQIRQWRRMGRPTLQEYYR